VPTITAIFAAFDAQALNCTELLESLGYKTVLKPEQVSMFLNVECIFSAKWFSLGNLSLLTNFQKLCTVSITVTIVHFY